MLEAKERDRGDPARSVARKDWGAFCRMDMHCHSWASDGPVNVLAMRHGPSIPELAALGVRDTLDESPDPAIPLAVIDAPA